MRDATDRGAEWFRQVYDRYYPDVVRYGVRRLDGLTAAEELAQDVFLVAWRRRDEVPGRTLPWLYGVARRVLANRWRARRAVPPHVELIDGAAPDRHEGLARLVDVRAAMGAMSEDDQEILRLVGWEQLSVSEAALVLGCGRTAAKVRLHRARRRLADRLRDVPGPVSPVVTELGGAR
jgi:RNA polymerase sigma-70 factor (ECF subfamily)